MRFRNPQTPAMVSVMPPMVPRVMSPTICCQRSFSDAMLRALSRLTCKLSRNTLRKLCAPPYFVPRRPTHRRYLTLTSSTEKVSLALAGMSGGAPRAPYAMLAGMLSTRLPPSRMPSTPMSHPAAIDRTPVNAVFDVVRMCDGCRTFDDLGGGEPELERFAVQTGVELLLRVRQRAPVVHLQMHISNDDLFNVQLQ